MLSEAGWKNLEASLLERLKAAKCMSKEQARERILLVAKIAARFSGNHDSGDFVTQLVFTIVLTGNDELLETLKEMEFCILTLTAHKKSEVSKAV